MPFAIKVTTFVNKTKINSYLVQVTNKEVITTSKLISAAIFWREADCQPHIRAFRNISDHGIAIPMEVTSETETDFGRISSSLLV
jgi:hypothetical protein